MKALAIIQPYAGLIATGNKLIETRVWNTNIRGDILLCSSRTKDLKIEDDFLEKYNQINDKSLMLIKGKAICVANLIDCYLGTSLDNDKAFCNANSKYCLMFDNIRLINPFDVKCSQRWFNVDDELIKLL